MIENLGIQLYTLRNEMTDENTVRAGFKKIKEIGYDHTYQRRRIQDRPVSPQTPPQEPPRPAPPVLPIVPCPQPEIPKNHRSGPRPAPRPCRDPVPSQGITEFLKQLLPKGLDTGDLLVIMLLLLMSGDCQEDPNSALLTLLLYLFL